ncbi:DUF3363 domain-containing protein [Sphingomonas sp. PB4P5]|uniref:DUF3363 domain-containing protein n=1 Tax=Parasphingomonas puruogangriensis TaxID=3096155 RepID=UPI002FCCA47A
MPVGSARWMLKPDIEARLREIGDRGDIIKTMHRAMREAGYAIHEGRLAIHPSATTEPVVGRLVARGLQDEFAGTAYAIIDGIDGRHHHLQLDDINLTADAGRGAIVELRPRNSGGTVRRDLIVHSDLPIDRQVTARGATWLDRQLLAPDVVASNHGFGGEVREAIAARKEHLIGEGLIPRHGGRVMLNPTLIDTLRAADLRAATARIAQRTGLIAYETKPGGTIAGTYRERVTLASGRFAMIDDGLGFQLVPWRPELERSLGSTVTGTTATDGGIGWTLGRSRGLSI